MTSSEVEQNKCDEPNSEITRILEEMLETDETITARALVRKHSSIGHASSVTRNQKRSSILKDFQEKQKQYRVWHARAPKISRDSLSGLLAQRDLRIAELERQVSTLRLSHLAMIRTVGELGGMGKLLTLYATYGGVQKELMALDLVGQGSVQEFPTAPGY
jgi:hypothetical protein